MGNETATARPTEPEYFEVAHRAHLEFASATFGMWFPFWAVLAVVAVASNWKRRKVYERSLIEWALAQPVQPASDGGERPVLAAAEVTRPDLVPVGGDDIDKAA